MKISKYVHSCLLVEEHGTVALIDPGNYTAQANVLDLESIAKLDYLVITHEHADHMDIPLIKKISVKFPGLQIMSNSSVKSILEKEGLIVLTGGNEDIALKEIPHEAVFGVSSPVKNVLAKVFGKLMHPGDSFQFGSSAEILALPVQAPWGHLTEAMEKAVQVKPKAVIPIHDWHWNEEARKNFFERISQYLQQHGIAFYPLEGDETIEI
ncbi:MAG: MBL fold metallo-hydrolase [Candidatus Wildermuthbacteria bacterium]|nr:MBL fold metallo-hydrolase [Candidatus Wildermuthbacteria bacterium]